MTDKKPDKIAIEINKMRADMRHDIEHELHWEANRQHWETNRQHWEANLKHWDKQEKHWKYIYFLGFVAVIINGLKSLWS